MTFVGAYLLCDAGNLDAACQGTHKYTRRRSWTARFSMVSALWEAGVGDGVEVEDGEGQDCFFVPWGYISWRVEGSGLDSTSTGGVHVLYGGGVWSFIVFFSFSLVRSVNGMMRT